MENKFEEACQVWEQGKYEEALKLWSCCLDEGICKNEIREIIHEAFIEPNRIEVETLLKEQNERLNLGLDDNKISEYYRDMRLKYLCFSKGNYYVYDSVANKLLGHLDYSDTFDIKEEENGNAFNDMLLVNPQNEIDILCHLAGRYKQNVYCLCEKKIDVLSVYAIPEVKNVFEKKIIFFESLDEMENYFLENKEVYLPKQLYGGESEEVLREVSDVILGVHEKRCTTEYRDDSNVLLSICIPTYNRGKMALELTEHLLKSSFDAEIEVVISDNASMLGEEEYRKLANHKDARVNYSRAEVNGRLVGNFRRVIEQAKGKYVLLVADEDIVEINRLGDYLSILRNCPETGIVRGSGLNGRNTIQYEAAIDKVGDGSFERMFLNNNYISGDIYINNEQTREILNDLYEKFAGEECLFFYPHMLYGAVIAAKYDVICSDKVLIIEGEEDEVTSDFGRATKHLLAYMTMESRLNQLHGWSRLIEYIDGVSLQQKMNVFLHACVKTFHLLYLVREYLDKEWKTVYSEIMEKCCVEFDRSTFLPADIKAGLGEQFVDALCDLTQVYINR